MLQSVHRKGYPAPPIRRVDIPKPGKQEQRPLGVYPVLPTAPVSGYARESEKIIEFQLAWPGQTSGSTHEITFNRKSGKTFWITGQNHDHIARITLDGKTQFFAMPTGSRPHGIEFDSDGHLWVSLEFAGFVVRVAENGEIMEKIDVRLHAEGTKKPINTNPHGLGLGSDGKTIWFSGKKTNTVGKINFFMFSDQCSRNRRGNRNSALFDIRPSRLPFHDDRATCWRGLFVRLLCKSTNLPRKPSLVATW